MSLLPKEHGAYGQLGFPLMAAFGVAGISASGILCAGGAIAAFLAHEPALVVFGLRGPRAQRELQRRATWWLVCCVLLGVAAGISAWLSMPPGARWSLLVPLAPAAVLAVAAARGEEKSWQGEVAAALAFSGAAVPVSMAGGAHTTTAMAVAIPYALLFVASTLAVRVVILGTMHGGSLRALPLTRRTAIGLACSAVPVLGLLVAQGLVPGAVVVAAVPGLLTAAIVALRPPAPARLRRLGWTLVGVTLLTTVLIVATVR